MTPRSDANLHPRIVWSEGHIWYLGTGDSLLLTNPGGKRLSALVEFYTAVLLSLGVASLLYWINHEWVTTGEFTLLFISFAVGVELVLLILRRRRAQESS